MVKIPRVARDFFDLFKTNDNSSASLSTSHYFKKSSTKYNIKENFRPEGRKFTITFHFSLFTFHLKMTAQSGHFYQSSCFQSP